MKRSRKYIAYLLIAIMPLSAWASAGAPCAQTMSQIAGSETQAVDPHAHHGSGAASTEHNNHDKNGSAGHASHQASAATDDQSTAEQAPPAECPCCDDCVAMCVLSSCSPVALTNTSATLANSGSETLFAKTDAFRVAPPPHVLFRPPIYSV